MSIYNDGSKHLQVIKEPTNKELLILLLQFLFYWFVYAFIFLGCIAIVVISLILLK